VSSANAPEPNDRRKAERRKLFGQRFLAMLIGALPEDRRKGERRRAEAAAAARAAEARKDDGSSDDARAER
jgi:hypothetical protein